jgi:CTP synthase (UTP-ammonia lyase)
MHLLNDEEPGPFQARSDLVDMLLLDPENTEALVMIIETELKGMRDTKSRDKITNAVDAVASRTEVERATKENILYWLTETTPDVRQLILVQTVEKLLDNEMSRKATIEALSRVSSQSNVDMVMRWVNSNVMTLNQAVYVLLYPDSSTALL